MAEGKRPWWRLPLCWLALCDGHTATGWDADGWGWIGWRCATCGRLEHKAPSGVHRDHGNGGGG